MSETLHVVIDGWRFGSYPREKAFRVAARFCRRFHRPARIEPVTIHRLRHVGEMCKLTGFIG